jgi:tetratricopeptide (TPR) repeat protein
MRLPRILIASALCAVPSITSGQNVAALVARGDSAHTAFDPAGALAAYELALTLDSANTDALGKASRSAIDLAESLEDGQQQRDLFRKGERLARRAVAGDSASADNWFHLARALGRTALSVGVRDRVKFAVDIRLFAEKSLAIDPNHAGALHVMGMWHAEVKRLRGFELFFARNFLGGGLLGKANWKDAIAYMERAVEVDPDRLSHRLDLAGVYASTGDTARARENYEWVINATTRTDFNDALYKKQAEERLKRIK